MARSRLTASDKAEPRILGSAFLFDGTWGALAPHDRRAGGSPRDMVSAPVKALTSWIAVPNVHIPSPVWHQPHPRLRSQRPHCR
jgi:hypothetical protein